LRFGDPSDRDWSEGLSPGVWPAEANDRLGFAAYGRGPTNGPNCSTGSLRSDLLLVTGAWVADTLLIYRKNASTAASARKRTKAHSD
jgi:hypothetical protein